MQEPRIRPGFLAWARDAERLCHKRGIGLRSHCAPNPAMAALPAVRVYRVSFASFRWPTERTNADSWLRFLSHAKRIPRNLGPDHIWGLKNVTTPRYATGEQRDEGECYRI